MPSFRWRAFPFALGFGLLATPLMRRLSALGLLLIFTTAVYPFGRIDLIGHALIMMMIVAIAVDHTRDLHFLNAIRRKTVLLPVSLAGFMAVFAVSYWGTHAAIYGVGGNGARNDSTPLNPHPRP